MDCYINFFHVINEVFVLFNYMVVLRVLLWCVVLLENLGYSGVWVGISYFVVGTSLKTTLWDSTQLDLIVHVSTTYYNI